MLELANRNDTFFAALLVLPAFVAFVVAYCLVSLRLHNPPRELIGRLAASAGAFSAFLAVADVALLPAQLQHLSLEVLCLAVPVLMLVLGASWGVFGATIVAWWRLRRTGKFI